MLRRRTGERLGTTAPGFQAHKGRQQGGLCKKLQTRIPPNHSHHLRILLDPRSDATDSPPTPSERRWRPNGYSDQPLVTNGAGAATGYLPTGLLPTGYLPTGYLPTGAGAAATGCGRGRSAATAVPTKAKEAIPRIANLNI